MQVIHFQANFFDLDVTPWDVRVATDGTVDVIVQSIELLQEAQFGADLEQFRMSGRRKTKQLFAARINHILGPQVVEFSLTDKELVVHIPRVDIGYQWIRFDR